MSEAAKPRTPSDLGTGGKKFFREVIGTYDLDPHEVRVLHEAARTVDEMDRVRRALDAATDLVVKGSTGQPCEHPLLGSLRNHRKTFDLLLARMNLPDSEGETVTDGQKRSQRAHDGRWASARAVREQHRAADLRASRGA